MPAMVKSGLWLLLAAALMGLPAAFNTQPFLFPDTAGYVRSVDFLVTRLGSPQLATEWARGARYAEDYAEELGLETDAAPETVAPPPANAATAAPADATPHDWRRAGLATERNGPEPAAAGGAANDAAPEAVAGPEAEPTLWKARSIYYGVVAYIGYLVSHFWVTLLFHGFVLAFTAYTFASAAFRLQPPLLAGVFLPLALLTPAAAAASYVMPDVFAGIGVVALATLFAFPERLSRWQMVALGAVIAFSAVSHTATLLLLIPTAIVGALVFWLRRDRVLLRDGLAPLGVAAVGLMTAIAADAAYGAAVRIVLGKSFTGLPIPMAQLVEDGPGARIILEKCDELDFAVCAFPHVVPMEDSNDFLFSADPSNGVLLATDPVTQRAIAAEQTRFIIATVRHYPWETFTTALDNWWTQMNMFEISEYNYTVEQKKFWRTEETPDALYARFLQTPGYNGNFPTGIASFLFTLTFWASVLALAAIIVTRTPRTGGLDGLSTGLLILIAGVVINAAVCGVLAGPYDRYGARAAWVVPLAAFIIAAAWARDRGWFEPLPRFIRA